MNTAREANENFSTGQNIWKKTGKLFQIRMDQRTLISAFT